MKSLGYIRTLETRFTLAMNMRTGIIKWYMGSFQVPGTRGYKSIDKALTAAKAEGWIQNGSEFIEYPTPGTY
jgi:hypothetical protein